MTATLTIRRLSAPEIAHHAPELAALLVDAVSDGASLGFMQTLTLERAAYYWHDLAKEPAGRLVLVAEDATGIAGTVTLTPLPGEHQPHRAEVGKMIVLRRARGRGLGNALMIAAEQEAQALGRTLLTLLTRDGSAAERLYLRLGWSKAGVIPEDSLRPDGEPCAAAIYFKRCARRAAPQGVFSIDGQSARE